MGSFRRQTPGETGPKGRITWTALSLDPGLSADLFVLGSCQWFWSHWRGRSVPCYAEFTANEVACPHCGTRDYWQGYLPTCNEVGQRFLVLVKEANKPVIDKLNAGMSITAHRARGKGQPTTVRHVTHRKGRALTPIDEQALESLESSLVVMWRDQVLKDWYAAHAKTEDNLGLAIRAKLAQERADDKREQEVVESLRARVNAHNKRDSDTAMSLDAVLPHVNGTPKRAGK